jgi:hypothetical protein
MSVQHGIVVVFSAVVLCSFVRAEEINIPATVLLLEWSLYLTYLFKKGNTE